MVISFTIPDAQVSRFVTIICTSQGYQATIPDANGVMIPNPETQSQFAKRAAGDILANALRQYETAQTFQGVAQTVTPLTIS